MLAALHLVLHLPGAPATGRGDDLALATAGLIAIACIAWLIVTTLACVFALARGNQRAALRIAGFAPPFARRILQAALVSAITLTPASAHAAAPSAPITLHVGADGRVTTAPAPRTQNQEPAPEVPVVRAPATSVTTTTSPPTTVPATTVPPTTPPTAPTAAPRAPIPSHPRPSAPTIAPSRSAGERSHVVRAGDNLWRIAATELTRAQGRPPIESDIAGYWQRVIAANRATLRSGDPSLIFPGEVVTLPLD